MTTYVPAALRRLVADRAEHLCEYCLIHEDDTFFGCQIEHIVSEKHGGATVAENLAFACVFCNQAKGSDIGSISAGSGQLVRLFDPRRDAWSAHFQLAVDGVTIEWLTDAGEVTARLLRFNHPDRVLERRALRSAGRFPSAAAAKRMVK
jgi:hypothetical protein